MEKKICCEIGHYPDYFPLNYSDNDCNSHQEYIETMSAYIDWFIRKHGFNHFICGSAPGVDTDFAETIIEFSDNVYPEIKLEIVTFPEAQNKNTKYANILQKADKVTYLSDTYSSDNIIKHNEYMVDNSDIVFAFWNENKKDGEVFDTIEYAQKKNKRVELFILNHYI